MLEEKENPFFRRKDVKALVKHEGSATPAKSELVKNLAASNSVDETQVVIDFVFTKKGEAESLVKAKILKEKPAASATKEVQKVETQTSQSA